MDERRALGVALGEKGVEPLGSPFGGELISSMTALR